TGDVAPSRRIAGVATFLGLGPLGVALDPIDDSIIASAGLAYLVFPRTGDGNVAPTRSITNVTATGALLVDTAHDELIAAVGDIVPSARTASGSAAPLRRLGEHGIHLSGISGITADPDHDEILVTSHLDFSVTTFTHPTSTSASPSRVMTGVYQASAIAVDTMHDELALARYVAPLGNAVVYPRTAGGDAVATLRTITPASSSNQFSNTTGGIVIDTAHDELLVANLANAPSIDVFARTADGTSTPLRSLAITCDGQNDDPYGVALDLLHDEIAVA